MMASSDVRDDLECSICLNIYTDPVTLRCGHNFCRVCADRVLDIQKKAGAYNCPECREEFLERPALRKNITLSNIVERFYSTELKEKESRILCTNCIHAAVPAVKTCLLCECSLCADHLRVHSTAPEHILIEPTASLGKRKCAVHKKVLEYYCTKDATYICVSCRLDGEHKEHKTCLIEDMADQKKTKLKTVQKKLTTVLKTVEQRIEDLKGRKRKTGDKATGEAKRVTALFGDLKKQLEDLEKKVLTEISEQAEKALRSVSHLMKKLEFERDDLSSKLHDIEKLVKATDSFSILQESLKEDFFDTSKGNKEDEACGGDDLDEGLISEALHTALSDFATSVKGRIPARETLEIFLDTDTACEDITVSGDLKTISRSETKQYHPQRFLYYPQVLSTTRFSSGQHSWEVETCDIGTWRLGVCYPSISRTGDHSYFGDNKKSWCLRRYNNQQYSVIHNSKELPLTQKVSCHRLRVCLDYEAGQISFYELSDPIRCLHTFTATFSEPLHAAFCVWDDWMRITG